MIHALNLHRSYTIAKKQIEVLHGLDLHIRRGEKVFLCGPSGAGKTTLMYTLAGLEPPQQGKVVVDGEDIYALSLRRRALFRNKMMGFIFQNYMLMPELTALENASLATFKQVFHALCRLRTSNSRGQRSIFQSSQFRHKHVVLKDESHHLIAEKSPTTQ